MDNDRNAYVYGINPVKELIQSGTAIEKAWIAKHTGQVGGLAAKLRQKNVPIVDVGEARLTDILKTPEDPNPNHQGIAAMVSAHEYAEVEDIFQAAQERGEDPLIVVLDGITDPHNLGAIIRSAEALGAHGMVFAKRRSAGLTPLVGKTASGALSYIRVARVPNIAAFLDQLKERGLWIAGTAGGERDCSKTDLGGPLAVCIGSEGEGLSQLVRKKCDFLVGIPLYGKTESINASCAAAVILYEIGRQRHAASSR